LTDTEIEEAIFQIKARQREYEMHDPWCAHQVDEQHQRSITGSGMGIMIKKRPCNCWLVTEEY
jgi:hypothetical protein